MMPDENKRIDMKHMTRRRFLGMAGSMALLAGFATMGCSGEANRSSSTNAGSEESSSSASVDASSQNASTETEGGNGSNAGALVAYFSRAGENYDVGVVEKGNTEILAEEVAALAWADLFHIETVEPYPEDYRECTDVAQAEREDDARPAIKPDDFDWDAYDTIYLGYPIWWGDMPMAVYTFIEAHDWNGKKVVPFSTHAGSGLAGTPATLRELCTGASVTEGATMTGVDAQSNAEAVAETAQEIANQ